MNPSENRTELSDANRASRRDKALMYGLVVSLVGLPVGIILKLPVVWGLAILGIAIGGTKIVGRYSNLRP